MGDPSFLNGYRIMNMECFPFLRFIRRSTDFPYHQFGSLGLVFDHGLKPWGVHDIVMGRVPNLGFFCRPVMDASPLQGPFPRPMGRFLGTISCPLTFCRSELGQGLNCFLDRAASSTWPNRVCWSRLVAINCIAIMMASLDFRARFG